MRFIFVLLVLLSAVASKAQSKFLLPDVLKEASGVVYASVDSIWWINDSGDTPTLYLTDDEGNLLQKKTLPIRNVDWEELSYDDQGNIYIGDCGNNKNARKNLKIYIYNPITEAIDSIEYRYPDQQQFPPKKADRNFDMEGFFWLDGTIHLFSKNKIPVGNYYTKHYTLPARAGNYVAQLRDSIYLKNRVVTAAAISPDRKVVALLAYDYKKLGNFLPKSATSIFFIENFEETNFLRGTIKKCGLGAIVLASQYEALDFVDNKNLIVASERTSFYKQKARFRKVKRVDRPETNMP